MSLHWPEAPRPPSPIAGQYGISITPFQQRQAAQQRASNAQARVFRIHGFIAVSGTGMSTQDVNFPVRFLELPALSFSWSLEDGQQLQQANFPRVDVGVARWLYEEHPMQVRYYAGAQLAITASGRGDQKLIVHWQAEGRTIGTLGAAADQTADGVL